MSIAPSAAGLSELTWVKSSYSTADGADCVEVAHTPGTVLVRDSKRPAGARLALTPPRRLDRLRGPRRHRVSRSGSAVETVLRQRRPDPACWDAVVDAACSEELSYDAGRVLIQAGPAIARHTDRLARALRRRRGFFGTAVGHDVSVLALALAGA
ncbi:DUF397 domain-containing protein [Streptomyces sp. NPDC090021]|uniref:DUF397 domain-containing protein n=1 Tax=Streptomyces sp. NPDC090021 TaxID=3365919 RepID=UPI00380577E6